MDEHHGFESDGQGCEEEREGPKEVHQPFTGRGIAAVLPDGVLSKVDEFTSIEEGEHEQEGREVGHLSRHFSEEADVERSRRKPALLINVIQFLALFHGRSKQEEGENRNQGRRQCNRPKS